MFTPQEVTKRSEELEKAVFGGYSVSSVEELLTPLSEDYAALYKENATLKSQMKILAEKLEEYRQKEEDVSSALVTAQKTAAELLADAQRKSARMLSESEQKLRARNQELMLEVNAEQERVAMAKQAAAKFIVEIEDRVQAQLVALEKLKQMDLTTAKPAPAEEVPAAPEMAAQPQVRRVVKPQEAKPVDTAKEIEENISRILSGGTTLEEDESGATKVIKPVQ